MLFKVERGNIMKCDENNIYMWMGCLVGV